LEETMFVQIIDRMTSENETVIWLWAVWVIGFWNKNYLFKKESTFINAFTVITYLWECHTFIQFCFLIVLMELKCLFQLPWWEVKP